MHRALILASIDRQSSLGVEDVPVPPLEVWCRLSKSWCSLYYRYHCVWSEIFRVYKDCPGVYTSKMYFVQHFHLSSAFFPTSFSLTIPKCEREQHIGALPSTLNEMIIWKTVWSYQCPATLMWRASRSSCVGCSVLAASLIQLWICWPCARYSGPSKILGDPRVSSSSCSAVIFNLPSSNSSTQGLGTIFLGIAHIHNAAMAIVPRGKNLSATDCCEKVMSNVKVTLQHSLAYLNIANFKLNTQRV